jgi:uncharacterized membrane protein YjjP (DUF1212 family)
MALADSNAQATLASCPPDQGKPHLSTDQLRDLLATALDAGGILMQAGATIPVVEQVVHHLGTSMGADWMDVYCTPTGIIAMATSGGEHRTRVHRIVNLGVDLARVDAVTALSREAETRRLSVQEVRPRLAVIREKPRAYGRWLTILAVAVGCGAFAFRMGGSAADVAATVAVAAIGQWSRVMLLGRKLSPLVTTAAVATLVAVLGVLLGLSGLVNGNTVTSAGVLLLVPGVFLVGAVYELISGNLVSGLARGAYAMLLVMAIGAGIVLTVSVFLAWTL